MCLKSVFHHYRSLSLQASSSSSSSTNNIVMDPTQLALGDPVRQEVGGTGKSYYRQYLRHGGTKLVLLTPLYESGGLVFQTHGDSKSVLVNISPNLRATLNVVENFVTQNVSLPADAVSQSLTGSLYKPLWHAENMMITVSRWCKFYRLNDETKAYEIVPMTQQFNKGIYQISIEVPYVYIGPHKEGQSFSLTARVVQVLFQPHKAPAATPSLPPPADCLNIEAQQPTPSAPRNQPPPPPPPPPSQETKDGKKKKGKKHGSTSLPLFDFK